MVRLDMADEENPGGVEELCEFWEWALAKKRELEARVQELSDPEQPGLKAFEVEVVADAKARGASAERVSELTESLRRHWTTENEKQLRFARSELKRFLYGPIATSYSGRRRFRHGLSAFAKSPPRYGFRQAWEADRRNFFIALAIEGLHRYFSATAHTGDRKCCAIEEAARLGRTDAQGTRCGE